jgi:4-hydroxybenzoate polyprenyltransferase
MFTSVRRCTGDLACEVLILTCFGDLLPDRQLYLGMGTMIVKETIRSWKDVSAPGDTCRRFGDTPIRVPLPGRSIPRLFHTVSREFGFSNRLKSILISIYLLELVGASAITTLGCVACTLLQIEWGLSAPLWFAGYLFVYNADRLQLDPADRLNTPLRFSWERRLRGCRIALVWISAVVLGMWPVLTGRFWLLFPLAFAAGLLCFYSRPIPGAGFRLKDLPYLKSLLAPAAIAIVLVPWPALESGNVPRQRECLVFSWIFLILTINALIFDYRDIVGDRLNGTKTIPAGLGHRRTRGLLILLSAALVFVSIALSWLRLAGPFMPGTLTFGCAVLLWSLRRRAPPALLSLLADSLLFLPAIGEWLR